MDESADRGDNMADVSQDIPSAQAEKHATRWDRPPNPDSHTR